MNNLRDFQATKRGVKKYNRYLLSCLFITVFLHTTFLSNGLKAQGNPAINAGIGFPEGINLGVQYALPKSQQQLGVYLGSFPTNDSDVSYLSISGDVFYHFAGTSSHSPLKTWFYRININYVRYETEDQLNTYLFNNHRIGKQIHTSDHFGFEWDAGIALRFFKDEVDKETTDSWFNLDYDLPFIIPTFGLRVFYRF